jgi:polyisoprenoid-binding protein YceI
MSKVFPILILLVLVHTLSAQNFKPSGTESKVTFKIKNFGSTVDGSFSGLKGSVVFDEANLSTAQIDLTVDAATIDTGIGMRDNHLRKKDYFNVTEYPAIRFVSTKLTSSNSGTGLATGKLTIKNVTREIAVPFTYAQSNNQLKLKGEFKINRRDFGVGGSSISMADELKVFVEIVAN